MFGITVDVYATVGINVDLGNRRSGNQRLGERRSALKVD